MKKITGKNYRLEMITDRTGKRHQLQKEKRAQETENAEIKKKGKELKRVEKNYHR